MAVNRLDRLGRLSGMWLDMATRSQNQGMLGYPGAMRMILLHGESCNFSTTCPIWLMVGRCMLSDPTMAYWVYPLLWPGDPVLVTNRGNLLLNLIANKSIWAGATCCRLSGRPLEGETTLFEWSALAGIACLLPHSAGLECVGLRVTCFLVHQVKLPHSRAHVGPTSCLLPCLCMTLVWCCQLLQVLSCLSKVPGTLLKPGSLL